jgi:hypothetical protein
LWTDATDIRHLMVGANGGVAYAPVTDILQCVRLPILILCLAVLTGALMAYGVDPAWVHHSWGLGLIMFARRAQWPLVTVSILLCLALLVLVISGRRRAWWLLGLAPVLALFAHRFVTAPINRYSILDEPAFAPAADVRGVADGDYVVGLTFADQAYAYPYSVLFESPVIVQSDRDKRLVLMWSAGANAATAVTVRRDFKARDLEIVSDPAGTLLLYNARLGQFIVALTGMTPAVETPSGFLSRLVAVKTTWSDWIASHPQTRLILPPGGKQSPLNQPLPGQRPVTLIATTHPLAMVPAGDDPQPQNLHSLSPGQAGDTPVLIFRDPETGRIRAFERRIEPDLAPTFRLNHDARRKSALLVDDDTNSGWSAAGIAVDGDKSMRGHKLAPIEVQEDVYWGPAKFWIPALTLLERGAVSTTAPVRPIH